MKKPLLTPLLGLALTLAVAGCAKGPSGVSTGNGSSTGEQLFVSMKVSGTIDPVNDFYYVCFNYATGPSFSPYTLNSYTAPYPVITPYDAGGNGFAGGAFTTYVEIHQNQTGGVEFGVWWVSSDLLTLRYYGQPINGAINGNTITFQIPLSDIAACSSLATTNGASNSSVTPSDISALVVNFITTDNNTPTTPQVTAPKLFDALGDPLSITTVNSPGPVTVPTGQDTTYSGTDAVGDVATYTPSQAVTNPSVSLVDQSATGVANLDITNWSIQFTG